MNNKLTQEQLQKFKDIFVNREKDIIEKKRDIDLNVDGGDETDLVQAKMIKNTLEQLSVRDQESLYRIREAISKIDSGKFGLCEECGEPITFARLQALPECKLCISCAEEQEMLSKHFRLV